MIDAGEAVDVLADRGLEVLRPYSLDNEKQGGQRGQDVFLCVHGSMVVILPQI